MSGSKRIDEFSTLSSPTGNEYLLVQNPDTLTYNKATITSAIGESIVQTTGDQEIGGQKTFTGIPLNILLPTDSSPGIPNLGPYGAARKIVGSDGTIHAMEFADLDGDGDYDADRWRKDNGYDVYENEAHDRFMEYGQSERGRIVRTADTNGNWILSGLNYSGSTDKHLFLGKYNGPSNAPTPWQKFDKSNGNVLMGSGMATTDTPAAPIHVKSTVATMGFLESTNATSRITFRASGSTSNTGVGVGAEADDLVLRAGSTNHGRMSSAGKFTTKSLLVSTPTPPATAASTGTTGQIEWDANYVYVCVATNTWKRAALSTW